MTPHSLLRPAVLLMAAFSLLLSPALAAPKKGDRAPQFHGLDQDGAEWKLADHLGKGPVLVYFYPKDETPGCTKEACGLRDRMGDLRKDGVSFVGISRDDAESHRKFREKHQLNFPLLVDTDGRLTRTFGAEMEGRPLSRRISFLIDATGRVAHVTDDKDAQVHLDEMKAAIAAILHH